MSQSKKISSWGVLIFPGSNCDHDGIDVLERISKQNVNQVWHKEADISQFDGILLPGGFSYGDYLRSGSIARFSSILEGLPGYIKSGKLVLGICNGFQILTEAGSLPGVLLRNHGLRFICKEVNLRIERTDTPFTSHFKTGQVISIPIAHNEGCFYLPAPELKELEMNKQVVFRYCDSAGNINEESNPNGSVNNIAGIVNKNGNVLGMMPHPERRCDPLLGKPDGLGVFNSMIDYVSRC